MRDPTFTLFAIRAMASARPVVYPLVEETEPILRRNVMNEKFVLTEFLIESMFLTMRAHRAAGLAAPQIGLPFPIFVTDWGEFFVRPVIDEVGGGFHFAKEGCLSLPGRQFTVQRAAWAKVNGCVYEGVQARVVQHELDHLHGRMIDVWKEVPVVKEKVE